jgi:pilus assembly protein Flp/PilA
MLLVAGTLSHPQQGVQQLALNTVQPPVGAGFFTLVSSTNRSKGTEAMRTLAQRFVNFLKREDGPTAVEYAVMLALIIVVCITAITALGTNANKTFSSVSNTIGTVSS